MHLRPALVALAALAGPAVAAAHELWFLPDPGPAAAESRLYFGDSPAPGEAERVAEIAHAQVWSAGRTVAVRRLPDGLEAAVRPDAPTITSAAANRGVIDFEGKSFIITLAAYAQTRPVAADRIGGLSLGLDDDQLRLLWVEKPDGTSALRATRVGTPVADAAVKVFRGTTGSTEIRTDAHGEISVPDRTRGGVSCLALVDVPTPGTLHGKPYSFIRYKATLTLYPPAP